MSLGPAEYAQSSPARGVRYMPQQGYPQLAFELEELPPFPILRLNRDDLLTHTSVEATAIALVAFYQPDCDTCAAQDEELARVAQEMNYRANVATFDVSQDPNVINTYRIEAFPTTRIFYEGYLFEEAFVGLTEAGVLIDAFDRARSASRQR